MDSAVPSEQSHAEGAVRAANFENADAMGEAVADAPEHKPTVTFMSLPSELRIKIYKATWETRTIKVGSYHMNEMGSITTEGGRLAIRVSPAGFDNEYFHCAQYALNRGREQQESLVFDRMQNMNDYKGDLFLGDRRRRNTKTVVTFSQARPPVTLYINAESRDETLKHYQLAFSRPASACRSTQCACGSGCRDAVRYESHVYFNFAMDTLKLSSLDASYLLRRFRFADLARVRSIAHDVSRRRDLCNDYVSISSVYDKRVLPPAARATDLGPVSTHRHVIHFGMQNRRRPMRYQKPQQRIQATPDRPAATEAAEARENNYKRGKTDRPGPIRVDAILRVDESKMYTIVSVEDRGYAAAGEKDEPPERPPLGLLHIYPWTTPAIQRSMYQELRRDMFAAPSSMPLHVILRGLQSVTFVRRQGETVETIATALLETADETARTVATTNREITEVMQQRKRRMDAHRHLFSVIRSNPGRMMYAEIQALARMAMEEGITLGELVEESELDYLFQVEKEREEERRKEEEAQEAARREPDYPIAFDFRDNRAHLIFRPGPAICQSMVSTKLLHVIMQLFPMVQPADDQGPDRQRGYHLLGARVADGWTMVNYAKTHLTRTDLSGRHKQLWPLLILRTA